MNAALDMNLLQTFNAVLMLMSVRLLECVSTFASTHKDHSVVPVTHPIV